MTSNLTSRKAFGVPSSASSRSHTQIIRRSVLRFCTALRCYRKIAKLFGSNTQLYRINPAIVITNIVIILFIPPSATGGKGRDRPLYAVSRPRLSAGLRL